MRGAAADLARVLFEKMEHLEPSEKGNWENLTEHERDFYVTCVQELARHPQSLRSLLSE
jgi:hypothetical protein